MRAGFGVAGAARRRMWRCLFGLEFARIGMKFVSGLRVDRTGKMWIWVGWPPLRIVMGLVSGSSHRERVRELVVFGLWFARIGMMKFVFELLVARREKMRVVAEWLPVRTAVNAVSGSQDWRKVMWVAAPDFVLCSRNSRMGMWKFVSELLDRRIGNMWPWPESVPAGL